MPTIEEKLKQMLIDKGLFEDMAEEIMQQVKADDINAVMTNRWGEPVEGYPGSVLAVLWISTRDTALEWIDENLPNAWFRPLFAE